MEAKIKVNETTWKSLILREGFDVSNVKMFIGDKYVGVVGYKVDNDDLGGVGNVYIKQADGWYRLVSSWGKLADFEGMKLRYFEGMSLQNLV